MRDSEGRKKLARFMIQEKRQGRRPKGVTYVRPGRFTDGGYDVIVDGYVVMFALKSNRLMYAGEHKQQAR